MTDCYKSPRQAGLWYEIKTIEDVIISKEKRGADASKERELLDSYRHYAKTHNYHSKVLNRDFYYDRSKEGVK